jgi:hypothetical protein
MPSLEQIQNYIRNRRLRIGELNNIDEIKDYCSTLEYNDDLNDEDLFMFGTQIGKLLKEKRKKKLILS